MVFGGQVENSENSNSSKINIFKDVLKLESEAILQAMEHITEEQVQKLTNVYKSLSESGGSLIFCGVGKSGVIATKLASTFCSLGLPSWYLHPVEALHGDLGRMNKEDAIVFISKSGTTEEILKLIPFLSSEKSLMIGLLGKVDSKIANHCDLVLNCEVEKEACINNQAPTTSSTLALAMGDAMAVLYEDSISLTKEKFAVNHPGGLLGKVLKMKVSDLMISKESCPSLTKDQTLKDAILSMTQLPLGGCAICDPEGILEGIIVEGDIRRTFSKDGNKGLETKIQDLMNENPESTGPNTLAIDALKVMETKGKQIQILPVVDEKKKFLGFVRLHDLVKEGFTA